MRADKLQRLSYEMNEFYRQQSDTKIGDLPVLLWAIGGVFTMILIHGLNVGYAQYRIWLCTAYFIA